MATVECKSVQAGVPSRMVTIDCITDVQVVAAGQRLDQLLIQQRQQSDAVAMSLIELVTTCPTANPSDLWHHVIYRHLLAQGWNDARWKRVSGFALERALARIYTPRLAPHGIRMRIVAGSEANAFLRSLGMDIRSTKVDLFLEGNHGGRWLVFGTAHVKSSIAERIQDDVPASLAFMANGLTSVALTMDAKSYPPPHGECINYGELGGRSVGIEKARIKRNYVEVDGQFDGLFSFNLRTPPSSATTTSGKRIYTLGLHDPQPDQLVQFLVNQWAARPPAPASPPPP
jgi:hypothetical protein